jgi:hypothetical protein
MCGLWPICRISSPSPIYKTYVILLCTYLPSSVAPTQVSLHHSSIPSILITLFEHFCQALIPWPYLTVYPQPYRFVPSQIFPAAQYSTNNAYLSTQMKSLCPSILGERGGTELGSTPGPPPIFRTGNSYMDEELRRKNENAGSISTGESSGRNGIKRIGKSQIVTGRCLPFSFSNSFRSIFSPSDGSHRTPSTHKNGLIGTGSGTSNSNSPKNATKDKDDKGLEASANEGHRTAGLLTPGRCPSPAIRRVSEDVRTLCLPSILFLFVCFFLCFYFSFLLSTVCILALSVEVIFEIHGIYLFWNSHILLSSCTRNIALSCLPS